jgi:hypothetical protein
MPQIKKHISILFLEDHMDKEKERVLYSIINVNY